MLLSLTFFIKDTFKRLRRSNTLSCCGPSASTKTKGSTGRWSASSSQPGFGAPPSGGSPSFTVLAATKGAPQKEKDAPKPDEAVLGAGDVETKVKKACTTLLGSSSGAHQNRVESSQAWLLEPQREVVGCEGQRRGMVLRAMDPARAHILPRPVRSRARAGEETQEPRASPGPLLAGLTPVFGLPWKTVSFKTTCSLMCFHCAQEERKWGNFCPLQHALSALSSLT